MKLEGTLFVVKDMATARQFYQDVLFRKVVVDLGGYVVFEGGLCLLTQNKWAELIGNSAPSCVYRNNVCELSFEDDDIDAFMTHLQRFPGIEILTPLKEYVWGQRSIRFYDPDQHVIEVGECMTVVVKRFLRTGLSVEETMKKSMFPREFVMMCKEELERN